MAACRSSSTAACRSRAAGDKSFSDTSRHHGCNLRPAGGHERRRWRTRTPRPGMRAQPLRRTICALGTSAGDAAWDHRRLAGRCQPDLRSAAGLAAFGGGGTCVRADRPEGIFCVVAVRLRVGAEGPHICIESRVSRVGVGRRYGSSRSACASERHPSLCWAATPAELLGTVCALRQVPPAARCYREYRQGG